jgi:hypothetical protein
MNEIELVQRKQRIKSIAQLGLLGFAGLLVSPFVFLAVKGVIGLALSAVIGLIIVNFAPVVGEVLGNAKIKAIKAEAARNPIETLQRQWGERKEALAAFDREHPPAKTGDETADAVRATATFPHTGEGDEES